MLPGNRNHSPPGLRPGSLHDRDECYRDFLQAALAAPLDDRLHVTCEFSTVGDTEPVLPGCGTDDEEWLVRPMFAPR